MGFNNVGVSIGNGFVLIGIVWAASHYAKHIKDFIQKGSKARLAKAEVCRYSASLSIEAFRILVRLLCCLMYPLCFVRYDAIMRASLLLSMPLELSVLVFRG
jgi:hypothetical protein